MPTIPMDYEPGPYGEPVPSGPICPDCNERSYKIPDINGVPPWMHEKWVEVQRRIDSTPPSYRCPKCRREFDSPMVKSGDGGTPERAEEHVQRASTVVVLETPDHSEPWPFGSKPQAGEMLDALIKLVKHTECPLLFHHDAGGWRVGFPGVYGHGATYPEAVVSLWNILVRKDEYGRYRLYPIPMERGWVVWYWGRGTWEWFRDERSEALGRTYSFRPGPAVEQDPTQPCPIPPGVSHYHVRPDGTKY